jgi:hypothetical protein
LCRAKATVISQSDKFDKLKTKRVIEWWHPYSRGIWCRKKEVAQRIKITVIYIPFFV